MISTQFFLIFRNTNSYHFFIRAIAKLVAVAVISTPINAQCYSCLVSWHYLSCWSWSSSAFCFLFGVVLFSLFFWQLQQFCSHTSNCFKMQSSWNVWRKSLPTSAHQLLYNLFQTAEAYKLDFLSGTTGETVTTVFASSTGRQRTDGTDLLLFVPLAGQEQEQEAESNLLFGFLCWAHQKLFCTTIVSPIFALSQW